MLAEPILAVARLVRALETLRVEYVVGGSLASSIYGEPRATNDVDVVVNLRLEHVPGLVTALGEDFYIDEEMAREAVLRRSTFNLIFQPSVFKLDIFVARLDSWTREELSRGRVIELEVSGERVALRFASPEDALLHKLVWFRMGGEGSERQWRDVLGVLRVQAGALDETYLVQWAEPLGVADLLVRAMREAA